MSTSKPATGDQVPPRIIPDESGNTAGVKTVKIEWQCPTHGGMNTTPAIASMEVLGEYIQSGLRQLIFSAEDAEHLTEQGWQMGLAEKRTAFDDEMDSRMSPAFYLVIKTVIIYRQNG